MRKEKGKYAVIGGLGGLANGLFGSGGGLFLVPLFTKWLGMEQKKGFCLLCGGDPAPFAGIGRHLLLEGRAGSERRSALSDRRWDRRADLREDLSKNARDSSAPDLWAADPIRRRSGGAGPMMWFLSLLAGALTGVLSGFGIGGGTLLILWLTLVSGLTQQQAGGINLLYFVCCALPALWGHAKTSSLKSRPCCGAPCWACPPAFWGRFWPPCWT